MTMSMTMTMTMIMTMTVTINYQNYHQALPCEPCGETVWTDVTSSTTSCGMIWFVLILSASIFKSHCWIFLFALFISCIFGGFSASSASAAAYPVLFSLFGWKTSRSSITCKVISRICLHSTLFQDYLPKWQISRCSKCGNSYKIWPQILTILIECQTRFNLLIIYLTFQSQDRTEINIIFRK